MNERAKITTGHLIRQAIVYLRQSSAAQVEHNRESTERQYALANKARELGWPEERILVIDEDLGLSGSGAVARSGFARLTAEVALARVGLVLGLEVSRLARNNADWHRLIDLAGLTDTLIGDADGIYHPALFNDRLLLGLKGTMSEAELHVLRARLNGGIRNKAARGELRRGLPVGFVWGEADGEVLRHPDEAVVTAIHTLFARFAETGSARRVWLWLRDQGHKLPLQMHAHAEIRWVEASYHAIHQVLVNPVYAGAYVYGKTRMELTLDAAGARKKRIRHLPRDEWQVLIKEHHQGYIDWQTYEANQQRIAKNTRPARTTQGGWCRERRRRTPAGPCQLRTLRPPSAHTLQRTYLLTGLSLLRRASRRGTRQLLPQHRRRANRRCRGSRLHCSARAGDDRSDAGSCRAARDGSRGRAQALAARCRAGELRGRPRRAPLSCRRS
jgi:DNA invertase Pin-like site-specific DNA recombinase